MVLQQKKKKKKKSKQYPLQPGFKTATESSM